MPFDSSWLSSGGVQGVQENMDRDLSLKKKRWETQQTQGAAEAFAQSLNPDGSLDEGRYYRLVSERGIAPALATGYRDWTIGQAKTQSELGMEREMQAGLGYRPDAPKASRDLEAQDQFLNPTGSASSSPLSYSSPQEFAERMAGRANPTRTGARAPSKTITESSAAPTTTPGGSGYGVSGASVSGEGVGAAGGTMTANDPRALEGMGMEPQPKYGQIQGFLATQQPREDGQQNMDPGTMRQQDSALFAWSPADEATASRKYGTALSSMMQAMGKEPGQYLSEVYDAAFGAAIPAEPNRALLQLGREGQVKYRQQQAEYVAGLQKAQAAGRKAVMDARQGLLGTAEKYGEASKSDERHEGDFAGRRAGGGAGEIIRTQIVSADEKAAGETIANAYLDLKSAEKRGNTFPNNYAAAVAKAKADGNVNEDVIVANLVAMGAWPDAKSLALKNLMRESPGALGGDIYKMVKQRLGDPGEADTGSRTAWFRDNLDNVRNAMQLKGYDIRGEAGKRGAREAVQERAKSAAGAGPKIGETRTIGGVTGVWDGKTWRRK